VAGKHDVQPWLTQRRLLQHANRCLYVVLNGLAPEDGIEWKCYNLGLLYWNHGKMDEAEKMYLRALQGYEKALGPENVTTFVPAIYTNRNLGSLFQRRGDLVKARILYSKALVGCEKVFGNDHLRCCAVRESLNTLDIEKTNNKLIDTGRKDGQEEEMSP
jgi:tetratricopeptide (TPR) repeat protein